MRGHRRSEFKIQWLSPLAGATWPIIRQVFKGNKVDPKYKSKVRTTYVFVTVVSAFRWIDRLWFREKVKKYKFREPPLFILGHWRSGTTFLHNLLTKDPVAAYTTTYQCVFPDNLKSKWIFKTFMRIFMPRVRPGDNLEISASFPQEDEYAISNLTHCSYYHFFYFPSNYRSLYKKYVRFESSTEEEITCWKKIYRALVIKALLNTRGSRIILKNPVNMGRMLHLSDIFPDARFVHIIRNPVIVYLSTQKFFTQLFPTLQLERFTEDDISEMILEIYGKMMRDYLEDLKELGPDRLIEIRYEELVDKPFENLEHIYKYFNFSGFQELKPAFEDYLKTLEDHEIDSYVMDQKELDKVLDHVGFAMKHWNYQLPENLEII
jgi:hypothetical protein